DAVEHLTPPRERGRQPTLDEKRSSFAPQDRLIALPGGEFQDRRDVFRLEIRIVSDDLFACRAGSKKVEHILHADPESANAGPATAHARVIVIRSNALTSFLRVGNKQYLRGRLRLAVQGDVPSAGRSGTLSGDSTTKALLDLFRKLFHGLFGDHTAFTSSIKAGTMSSANSA